jgi:glycosyltransferase involved in cell wall biosynthesis
MEKLSAAIITFNEEDNIARCIGSLQKVVDEIVILDSFSTDKTMEIALSMGARVEQRQFAGYIEQKNAVLLLTRFNYVLCLDADEELDETLQKSILKVKNSLSRSAGYTMNRCTFYCDQFIRHGLWYPDKKLRLVNKELAAWGGDNPHDKIFFHTAQHPIHLKGDILHYSYRSIEEHVSQNNKFSSISAETYYNKGKTTNLFKIFIHPLWSFILGYIVRLGFLDGFYGYTVALNIAHLTFLKHSKLYRLQKRGATGN